ncbi:MAG: hypothetical protein ACFFEO_13050 [Candidatus Thorarchaeota archaeon]
MEDKDNVYYHHIEQKEDKKEQLGKDNNVFNSNVEKEDDNSYPDLRTLFDEKFKESKNRFAMENNISPDSMNKNGKFGGDHFIKEPNTLIPKFSNNIQNIKEKDIKLPDENSPVSRINNRVDESGHSFVQKLQLQEKIIEYNERYQLLEKKIQEYDEKTSDLIKKKEEYRDSIKMYEEKTIALDERNEEVSTQIRKLGEAREKIMDLSKQIEEKKIDLKNREENLKRSEKNLEKIKFELEKNKIELEKSKLEFEMEKSNLDNTTEKLEKPYDIQTSEEANNYIHDKGEKRRGKVEILQNLMLDLTRTGRFKSCFLIDGKGMLLSEYSQDQSDPIAIGAMFSLIYTAVQRAVQSLNLYDLKYFKISSINGEFIVKNITIMNYERSFILLVHYDDSNLFVPDSKQIPNKKMIKRVLKNVKKDFFEYGNENKNLGIFDNLSDRINLLKKKYTIPQEELELTRLNLLNETSIKIKDLFEK